MRLDISEFLAIRMLFQKVRDRPESRPLVRRRHPKGHIVFALSAATPECPPRTHQTIP